LGGRGDTILVARPNELSAQPGRGGLAAAGRGGSPSQGEASAAEIERLATVLGRARARVLCAILKARTTEQVADDTGVANSTASEHLNTLAKAGLATRSREGRLVYYKLSERGRRLLGLLVEGDS
jgi:DNA-binding transcriptional ArsR family regulator